MKIISTGAADILLVEVPESAYDFNLNYTGHGLLYADDECEAPFQPLKRLPEGYNYTILGRAKELTEEQWALILPTTTFENGITVFNHPQDSDGCYLTGFEAGKSFLKSQGILLENPYANFECPNQWCENGYIDQGYGDKWRCDYCQANEDSEEEAQSKVKNPLVIKADEINPGE